MELKIINYKNKNWKYYVNYKKQKHMYLKIKAQNIIISAPLFVENAAIESFVRDNLAKVIEKLEQLKTIKPLLSLSKKEPYLYYLSQKLPIIFQNQKQTTFFIDEQQLLIYTSLAVEIPEQRQLLLKKFCSFFKQQAIKIIVTRVQYWSEIMNLDLKGLNIRSMKNKWGVCFPKRKIITLNYRLLHFAYKDIDYVIIHELAHLLYPNHSADFWKIVAYFCPHFHESKKNLKSPILGINDENY